MANIHHGLGNLARVRGEYDAAHVHFTASLTTYRELDDKASISDELHELGVLAVQRADYRTARKFLEESWALREANSRHGAMTLINLGNVARHQGDYEQARMYSQRALDEAVKIEAPMYMGMALCYLGLIGDHDGDHATACLRYQEGLALFGELRHRMHTAFALEGLARIILQGSSALSVARIVQRAARLWGAAESLRQSIGAPMPESQASLYQPALEIARAQIEHDAWVEAWTEGRAMNMEEAIAYALEGWTPKHTANAYLEHITKPTGRRGRPP